MSLDRQVKIKISSKRNANDEIDAQEWIQSVIGEDNWPSNKIYEDALQDGVILCKLMHALKPGSIRNVRLKGAAFQMRDNINQFQNAAREYGLPEADLFQSVDLYDRHNISQVTMTIFALGRHARKNGFKGPLLGPKMAEENKREFTDEQKRGGESTIGLQAGFNKGANQSGIAFGRTRHM